MTTFEVGKSYTGQTFGGLDVTVIIIKRTAKSVWVMDAITGEQGRRKLQTFCKNYESFVDGPIVIDAR